MIRFLINLNRTACGWLDKLFFDLALINDGNKDFSVQMAPSYLKAGSTVFDVGGGKNPFISPLLKNELNLKVIGVDISQEELNKAPRDAYDKTISSDICEIQGNAEGDLVICQAVLEHVHNTEKALKAIASLLKTGGKALLFIPNKNAPFARLNVFLPQKLKEKLLFSIYPESRRLQGFPSFYHLCTPNDILETAQKFNLVEIESRYYFMSSYFSFFFPLYCIWRIWTLAGRYIIGKQSSETFAFALIKV